MNTHTDTKRTILVHVNVELPSDDTRSADEIADEVENVAKLTWLDISVPLAEEV